MSIKKNQADLEKKPQVRWTAKVTLVRSRLSKMAPNICIGGHGCGPSSERVKQERVVLAGSSHWHGPEGMESNAEGKAEAGAARRRSKA